MPRTCWRWVVAVVVGWGVGAGADAADPPHSLPPPDMGLPGAPAAPPAEPTVWKDLTPHGFADLIPPEHHPKHEVPGHLAPAAPPEPGLFGAAEFLLLRPRRGAFDYVVPGTAGGLTPEGPVRSLTYELRGGVRAQLGYRFGESGWDLSTAYTYFRSNASAASYAAPGGVLFPTLTRPGLIDSVTSAVADANLEYNVYDLLVGRRAAVDEHLAVRAFGGLRFASVRQDFRAFYDGLDARRAGVDLRSEFEGFGPVVGGEAVLAGWRGFHLYGRASGGLLTGPADNPIVEANDGGRSVYARSAYDLRKVVPTTTLGVGGGWQYRTFSFRVGYEITHWFDLVDQPRFVDDFGAGKLVTRPADLSLEGLFVQVGLRF